MDQLLYDSLTPMERNCLRLAHHECKAEQIAHQLGIKASTVNSHVFSARKKLGGISRLSAADQLRGFEAVRAGVCAERTQSR
jgi:DNA-binding CsgD family transcriptional regulator